MATVVERLEQGGGTMVVWSRKLDLGWLGGTWLLRSKKKGVDLALPLFVLLLREGVSLCLPFKVKLVNKTDKGLPLHHSEPQFCFQVYDWALSLKNILPPDSQ